jgi:hypothetical protein
MSYRLARTLALMDAARISPKDMLIAVIKSGRMVGEYSGERAVCVRLAMTDDGKVEFAVTLRANDLVYQGSRTVAISHVLEELIGPNRDGLYCRLRAHIGDVIPKESVLYGTGTWANMSEFNQVAETIAEQLKCTYFIGPTPSARA